MFSDAEKILRLLASPMRHWSGAESPAARTLSKLWSVVGVCSFTNKGKYGGSFDTSQTVDHNAYMPPTIKPKLIGGHTSIGAFIRKHPNKTPERLAELAAGWVRPFDVEYVNQRRRADQDYLRSAISRAADVSRWAPLDHPWRVECFARLSSWLDKLCPPDLDLTP